MALVGLGAGFVLYGKSGGGSPTGARAAFVTSCGRCHALRDARTKPTPEFRSRSAKLANVGQDLDLLDPPLALTQNAIMEGRARGLGRMPARIVSPTEAISIARYIRRVARPRPVSRSPVRPDLRGRTLFREGNGSSTACAACHRLSAADTHGTTGPDLDEVLPAMSTSQIRGSILDPDAEVAAGFEPGIMPRNYGDVLSAVELERLVAFLVNARAH